MNKTRAHTQKWSTQVSALLKACADPTRLRLLNILASEGEVCVCHLVDVLGANQPKVSRHLAYLKRAGLVTDRKDGLWVHYSLSSALDQHCNKLIECLNTCAAEAPEMQRDIHMLRRIRSTPPLVNLGRNVTPRSFEVPEVSKETGREKENAGWYEQELEIELL